MRSTGTSPMRFSSSARKNLAVLVASALIAEPGAVASRALAEGPPEPCLILKFAAPAVTENAAHGWMEDLPERLRDALRVRWVAHPPSLRSAGETERRLPVPSPAELESIARRHDEARARLERLETAQAAAILDEAERDAAKYRETDDAASLLGQILLTRAVLLLWDGDDDGARKALEKARALRPGFVPDPAVYPPKLLESWSAVSRAEPPSASLAVRSRPEGASILVDGAIRGTTPAAIEVRPGRAMRVRLERPGFLPAVQTVRCLPGDCGAVDLSLEPDVRGALGIALAASPEGPESARLLSGAIDEAGAQRAAVFLLREVEGKQFMDVLSFERGAAGLRLLGRIEADGSPDGSRNAAMRSAGMLVGAGWPPSAKFAREKKSPWYYKWWFWGLVGAAAAGAAIAVSGSNGGGGGSGSSGSAGSISVNF